MKLSPLQIGELVAQVPIIQGAMGVGVSLSKLAAAVANEGGVGVISGVQIGFQEPDFESNNDAANERALRKHIRKARELSPKGIIGVNLLAAINNYKEMVQAAVEEKVDLIISGAGLPTDLPEMIKGTKTKIAPIVSSSKAAALITKLWSRRFKYIPDLVIVEGPEAGGHLGFSEDQLNADPKPQLDKIVQEVIDALRPYEEKYNRPIPVVAAGGIFDGVDIAKYIKLGVSGVQMGTRFVATEECDADIRFKEAYIAAKEEDIQLVKSPVGMPGRAINTNLTAKLKEGRVPVKKCYNCLKPCEPKTTPYCISKALIDSVQGNVEEGLVFSGTNAYRIDRITTVKQLMAQLVAETETALG
ncbi:NAD(P)H-dependent flavin oxidoreductase [Natronincola ferrireducens]|uniref:Probable nitronate monooxygenase n=1 Tax=Natronincola ferrireducens TaxID=393762 RepID=A0A1G9F2F4_9FIRM|nr:nitronate monooxygenase family protein [Natronincola ferrireducens]SDK82475.1 NAD(P)H-dependent flavin oxidoreductase YrpB, nitropropane dioxygenase family [Natronincola ferrireducens]